MIKLVEYNELYCYNSETILECTIVKRLAFKSSHLTDVVLVYK